MTDQKKTPAEGKEPVSQDQATIDILIGKLNDFEGKIKAFEAQNEAVKKLNVELVLENSNLRKSKEVKQEFVTITCIGTRRQIGTLKFREAAGHKFHIAEMEEEAAKRLVNSEIKDGTFNFCYADKDSLKEAMASRKAAQEARLEKVKARAAFVKERQKLAEKGSVKESASTLGA